MARHKPGDKNRISGQITQNQQKRIVNYNAKAMACPNMITTKGPDGEDVTVQCGNQLFDRKPLFTLAFIPEIVCHKPGGTVAAQPTEFFVCAKCGHTMSPPEWNAAARKAHEAELNKLIVPEDIKPNDNGDKLSG